MRFYRMIGNNIYNIMQEKNITIEELSAQTGFSNSDIRKIFNGRLLLCPGDVNTLCTALAVSEKELYTKHDKDVFVEDNFSNNKSREIILDYIDTYIDIRERIGEIKNEN